MKKLLHRGPFYAIALFLGTVSLQAALPLYEPFDYSPVGADLTGQTPDGGTTVWQVMGTSGGVTGTDPITIASGSLTIQGLTPSLGNSITSGGLGLTNRISLGLTINTGTVYYSFAFQVTDLGGLTTNGGLMAGFNNATGDVGNQPTFITASSRVDGFTIDRFNMRQNTTTSVPAATQWDKLRFGGTWADVTPPTPPVVTDLARLPGGAFRFGYRNSSAQSYSVHASENLLDWRCEPKPTILSITIAVAAR